MRATRVTATVSIPGGGGTDRHVVLIERDFGAALDGMRAGVAAADAVAGGPGAGPGGPAVEEPASVAPPTPDLFGGGEAGR